MDIHEQVFQTLCHVIEPELGINVVDLGLVYAFHIECSDVYIQMSLSRPPKPLTPSLIGATRLAIQQSVPHVRSVNVELVWNPIWEPTMMSAAARKKLGWEENVLANA